MFWFIRALELYEEEGGGRARTLGGLREKQNNFPPGMCKKKTVEMVLCVLVPVLRPFE